MPSSSNSQNTPSLDAAYRTLADSLRARRAELTNVLNAQHGESHIVELDQTRVGRLTRMDAMAQQEMSRATFALMQTELRRVEAAVARVDNGKYGLCCQCREPVELTRLQSDPAAPFCLPCVDEMAEDRELEARRR